MQPILDLITERQAVTASAIATLREQSATGDTLFDCKWSDWTTA